MENAGSPAFEVMILQVVVDLGKFSTEEEAAIAYDRASVWCLGLTSRLNFPAEQQIGMVGFLASVLLALQHITSDQPLHL